VSRGPARFTQRDLAKAIKAVAAAGMLVARVEVDKAGKIIVVVGEPGKATAECNEWCVDDQD
jgi:hypothetical protein